MATGSGRATRSRAGPSGAGGGSRPNMGGIVSSSQRRDASEFEGSVVGDARGLTGSGNLLKISLLLARLGNAVAVVRGCDKPIAAGA